ncbi:hypothetical protein Pcinc_038994 [Petrolisthes cinctipes]|uniref:Secreted protein n=1 Tax=Petrolisthes cinctipes TaxID=88211 RepID=A0AAE1EMD2_PETCI|nr:hypothetical protein Pcinc_038994 [Petrolisthes cinctipes]
MQAVVVLLVVTLVCPILGYSPPPQILGHGQTLTGLPSSHLHTLPGTRPHVSPQHPSHLQTLPGTINRPHISLLNPGRPQTLPGTINRPHISHGVTSFKQTRPVNRPFRRVNTHTSSYRRTHYGRR